MNKFLFLSVFSLAFSFQIKAQSEFVMDRSGVAVAVLSKTTPTVVEKDLRKSIVEYSWIPKEGNNLTRGYVDTKNRMIFCYNLEFNSDGNSKQFSVSVKSAEKCNSEDKYKDFKKISLPKYPNNLIVNDGDTIILDVLKNNQTGAMIQDLIKITREQKPLGGYFAELEQAKNFTINDVQLQLVDYDVYINDKLIDYKVSNHNTAVGSAIAFTFNKRGTFIFSPLPNEKYHLQKIGTIEDNKLLFDHNGDSYKIVSKVSILGNGKKWNVWGTFEPFETDKEQMPDWMPFRPGSGTIEDFMDDTPSGAKPVMVFDNSSPKKP